MAPELVEVLLALSRWVMFAGVVAVVGAAGAQFVATRLTSPESLAFRTALDRRLPRLAFGAAALWALSLLGVFVATALSWFGPDAFADRERLIQMIVDSRWGGAWLTVFATSVGAVVAHALANLRPAARPPLIVLTALAAVVTTPLMGHAGGQGAGTWLLHTVHLAGAGVWLGTLLMLTRPTWPLWRDRSTAPGLRDLLRRFTPVALSGAAIVAATGALLTTSQIWPLTSIFDSPYGVTLARKLVAVALMAGLGWLNWRHFRPIVDVEARRRRLRQAVGAELVLGLVAVLVLTAWLAGLPTPAD